MIDEVRKIRSMEQVSYLSALKEYEAEIREVRSMQSLNRFRGKFQRRIIDDMFCWKQGTVLLPLWLGISALIRRSNLRINPALVDGYLPFAHFFPSSFIRMLYLLDSSVNISTCLSALMSSFTKRL